MEQRKELVGGDDRLLPWAARMDLRVTPCQEAFRAQLRIQFEREFCRREFAPGLRGASGREQAKRLSVAMVLEAAAGQRHRLNGWRFRQLHLDVACQANRSLA